MLTAPHRPTRNIIQITLDDTSCILKSEYGMLRLMESAQGSLRVTFTRRTAFSNVHTPYIANRETYAPADVSEDSEYLYFNTRALKARVSKSSGLLETFDLSDKPLFCESAPCALEEFEAYIIDRAQESRLERVDTADGVKTLVRESARQSYKRLYRARLSFTLSETEAIYGFGQPASGPANLRGRKLYLCQKNKEIALPCFVSTGGYGVLTDCGCPFIFSDTPQEGTYLYYSAVDELDYYIIPGSCEAAVKGCHALTGRPALPPDWAFGYLQSQERYESAEELIAVTQKYRAEGIGLDCIVLDWCSWPDGQWGQKQFDPLRFPDPAGMLRALHALNAKFMISIWPNMQGSTLNNAEMKAQGLLLPGGELYDALNPAARALYWQQAKAGLFDYGVDAWWCDSSEPWTSEWSREETPEPSEVYHETRTTAADAIGADNGNAYSFYHSMTMWEGQRAATSAKRVMNLTRSAWLGQQRFGTVTWSGDISADWQTLKNQIAIGLDICASGIPFWTQDIGGFFVKTGKSWFWNGKYENGWADPEFRELFVRWYEYATFLPIFRGHGTDIRRELTNLAGEEYAAVLYYNALRYRLVPYIYSMAGLVALEGGLMMKPLAFNYPDDPQAVKTEDAFLLGDNLLVCPVTEYGVRSRGVWLPEGNWYELTSGKYLRGGREYVADAPLARIPVFIKAGTILPVAPKSTCVSEARKSSVVFWVFPGCDGALRLYADAGDGYGYEQGEYTIARYSWNDAQRTLIDSYGNNVEYRVFNAENRGELNA